MKQIAVGGMSCGHCVQSVTQALEALEGVSQVQVDLEAGRAVFTCAENVTEKQIQQTIEATGFEAGEVTEYTA